jgi:hypothetical protein
MQPDILRRLREVAGSLAPWRIGFVEGGIREAPARPAPTAPPVEPDAPPAVAESAAAIADEEVRRRFLESAARYLGRKVKA